MGRLVKNAMTLPNPSSDEPRTPMTGVVSPRARRVLIVDDDEGMRSAALRLLRRRGIAAHGARTGADAMVLLQELPFSLIYCDVRLGDESGLALIPTFRAIAPEVTVVMLSGLDRASAAVEAIKAGAADYMTKPMDWLRFVNRTEELLYESRRSAPPLPLFSLTPAEDAALMELVSPSAPELRVEPLEVVEPRQEPAIALPECPPEYHGFGLLLVPAEPRPGLWRRTAQFFSRSRAPRTILAHG